MGNILSGLVLVNGTDIWTEYGLSLIHISDVPATDYDAMIGTFAGFVGGVVVLTEGLKGLFPNMKGWVTQLVSWCVGLVCVMLLWWLDAGFVSDVSWDIALLYGFGASLVANGVADTGLVQWVIGLFRKKREEAE